MYISPYLVPFSCQMGVMKGLTYHMIWHCNKLHYSVIFTPEIISMCDAFYCRIQKSIFNSTKFAIFRDKYLSQDLIVILRNITQLCQVRQRGRQTAGVHEHPLSYHEALAQCCFNVVTTSKTAGQHKNNIGSMPRVCWVAVTADKQTQSLTQF